MNKKEYLTRLKDALHALPAAERDEIIADYTEHFSMGSKDGIDESQISLNLGSPEDIARQYAENLPQPVKTTAKSDTTKLIILLALIAINLIIVLGPFIALTGFVAGLFIASIVMAVGGAAAIIIGILSNFITIGFTMPLSGTNMIFAGIGSIIFGVLLFIASIFIAKLYFKGVQAYVKFMKKLVND